MHDVEYRTAEVEDGRKVTAIVSKVGGMNALKALFGAYNYNNLVEFSIFTIAAITDESTVAAFVAINDTPWVELACNEDVATMHKALGCNVSSIVERMHCLPAAVAALHSCLCVLPRI
jgi:hypothetical protein